VSVYRIQKLTIRENQADKLEWRSNMVSCDNNNHDDNDNNSNA